MGAAASPGRPSRSCSVCSLLLSVLFAYSASVQLNDHDWYIWLPFYTLACLVCLAHAFQFSAASRLSAFVGLVGGSLLFIKVVLEGCFRDEVFSWTDLVSLDMEQTLVREKLGSLIVCLALWLELEVSKLAVGENSWSLASLHTGMFLLVSASIGLCAVYCAGEPRPQMYWRQSV
ncbi:unnamed protein product [Calypogeia fissa]